MAWQSAAVGTVHPGQLFLNSSFKDLELVVYFSTPYKNVFLFFFFSAHSLLTLVFKIILKISWIAMVPFCRLNSAYAFTLKCVFKWLHVFFGVCSCCEFHDVFSRFPFLESGF